MSLGGVLFLFSVWMIRPSVSTECTRYNYSALSPLLDLTSAAFPVTRVDPELDKPDLHYEPICPLDERVQKFCMHSALVFMSSVFDLIALLFFSRCRPRKMEERTCGFTADWPQVGRGEDGGNASRDREGVRSTGELSVQWGCSTIATPSSRLNNSLRSMEKVCMVHCAAALVTCGYGYEL